MKVGLILETGEARLEPTYYVTIAVYFIKQEVIETGYTVFKRDLCFDTFPFSDCCLCLHTLVKI